MSYEPNPSKLHARKVRGIFLKRETDRDGETEGGRGPHIRVSVYRVQLHRVIFAVSVRPGESRAQESSWGFSFSSRFNLARIDVPRTVETLHAVDFRRDGASPFNNA